MILTARDEVPPWLRSGSAGGAAADHRARPSQRRRAPRAAANARRRRPSPTDAPAHLGDVGGESVLRPRARERASATRRQGGSGRGAADSLEPGRARSRACRSPRGSRARGGAGRRRARRPDGAPRRGGRRPPRRRPGCPRRSRPESWRSTGSGSASRIRCSARRSGRAPRRRNGDRSTRGSPRSLRARRNERGISRSPPAEPSREIAAVGRGGGRERARAGSTRCRRRAGRAGRPAHARRGCRRRAPARPRLRRQAPRGRRRRSRDRPARAGARSRSCRGGAGRGPRAPGLRPWRISSTCAKAVDLYREALAEAEGDPALEAEIHLSLAEPRDGHGGTASRS